MYLMRQRPSPALVISLLALFVSLGGAGMAATGGNFILGDPNNTADNTTGLTSDVAAPALEVTSSSTGGSAVLGRHAAASGDQPGVYGVTKATTANATGVFGFVPSTVSAADSSGVKGLNYGAGRGVTGESTNGYGVFGKGKFGLVGTGTNSGVWTSTGNVSGSGVYGQNTGGGTGVFGKSTVDGPGSYGVRGSGRYGLVGNGSTSGVWARGTSFAGVEGHSSTAAGVYGESDSSNGVRGRSNKQAGVTGTSNGFDGVYGETKSDYFAGVSGHGGKYGVWGVGGVGGVGVEGVKGLGQYAGQFDGEVDVRGYLRLKFARTYLPDSDCAGQTGRLALRLDPATNQMQLWVCAPLGWQYLAG